MDKRITFGRRKSDWLVPLGFLTVGVIAAFWASSNRTQKFDLQRQNEALKTQVNLLERLVDNLEKNQVKRVAPGTVPPRADAADENSGAPKAQPPAANTPGPDVAANVDAVPNVDEAASVNGNTAAPSIPSTPPPATTPQPQ